MAVNVPPPPYLVPMSDKTGKISPAWQSWFRELYLRIGGTKALSNTELEAVPVDQTAAIATLNTTVSGHATRLTLLEANVEALNQGTEL